MAPGAGGLTMAAGGRCTGGKSAPTCGEVTACKGLAVGGGIPTAELTAAGTAAGVRATGGKGTAILWLGTASTGAMVLPCAFVAAYDVDAGRGTPLPGLIPGAWRISGRIIGAASTGALTAAAPEIATRLDATGLRPTNAAPGTAVTAPGMLALA